MKTKLKLLSLSIALFSLTACKSQENEQVITQIKNTQESILRVEASVESSSKQNTVNLPKVKNNLTGELDYTNNELKLSLTQVNGKVISVGKITKDGNIHFKLPIFDLKAIHNEINLGTASLTSMFEMVFCEDKDELKNPYDNEIYSHKYNAISIHKYGVILAILHPVSNKKVIKNKHHNADTLSLGSEYYWFYIDRAIDFKYECDYNAIKTADIHLNKGWNFIKEKLIEIQDVEEMEGYHNISPKKIAFYTNDYKDSEVEWYLEQLANDDEILFAKKLYNLTPLTKEQFEKWAPNKLDDLSVTTKEHGSLPEGQKNKNNMHLIYTDEIQKKEIDLYVVDCAKNPDDMEMTNFAYAMENEGKDKKDIKPYIAQYSEREKAMSFLYKVEDRLFVSASGVNITAEELWGYIEKLNVKKLLKKQDTTKIIYNSDSTTVKQEGIITNVKNDCWVDGTCSIEIDNKWWLAITYGKRDPSRIPKERGKDNIKFTEDNKSVGKKVKIYAKIKKGNKLTLEGSNTYYALIIK